MHGDSAAARALIGKSSASAVALADDKLRFQAGSIDEVSFLGSSSFPYASKNPYECSHGIFRANRI